MLYRGVHIDESERTGGPVIADLRPAIVETHSDSELRLYTPAGSSTMVSRPIPAGRPKPWGPGEWALVPARWDRWNAVFHHRRGEWIATWLLWSPAWEFLGWYVNLQEPLWQTRCGFDFRDLQLDVVVRPDRTWRWKDEADLDRSLETGLIGRDTEAEIRSAARGAIEAIESASPPFDDASVSWRPSPTWVAPGLPGGADLAASLVWSPSDAVARFA